MSKIVKRIASCGLLVFGLLIGSSAPAKAESVEVPSYYDGLVTYCGNPVSGMQIDLFEVGEWRGGSGFLYSAFSSIGTGVQDEMPGSCGALEAEVIGSGMEPAFSFITDEEGFFKGEDVLLNRKVFLVRGKPYEQEKKVYAFQPFLVYFPDSGTIKSSRINKVEEYSADGSADYLCIKKKWMDSFSVHEPVKVELYSRDTMELAGEVWLSDNNHWTFIWPNLDCSENYTVREIVPDGYTVTLERDGSRIDVVNHIRKESGWMDYPAKVDENGIRNVNEEMPDTMDRIPADLSQDFTVKTYTGIEYFMVSVFCGLPLTMMGYLVGRTGGGKRKKTDKTNHI